MQLIVDSGATKAAWLLNSPEPRRFTTLGLSPYFLSDDELEAQARLVESQLGILPSAVFFYGTGCQAEQSRHRLQLVLARVFPQAQISVETDLLGAARAACGRLPGICAILGTGSNACRYDGETIVETAGGLGFILGDEGSGASLGKLLLSAYLNREMPAFLQQALEARFELSRAGILDAVYRGATPSRYLAGFVPFLHEHQQSPFVEQLLEADFKRFAQRSLHPLDPSAQLPIHFIGSVAYHFRPLVERALSSHGRQAASFQSDPLEGLLIFHREA